MHFTDAKQNKDEFLKRKDLAGSVSWLELNTDITASWMNNGFRFCMSRKIYLKKSFKI